MVNRRRWTAMLCVSVLALIGSWGSATAVRAGTKPVVAVVASADTAAAGDSITLTATLTGAQATDVVVAALKSEEGWAELDREPAAGESVHTFEVTPPTLGRQVYRVGLLRRDRLIAFSAPAVVTGVLAVDPDPVVRGQAVTIRGVLPTAIVRPAALQAEVDGQWQLVDADVSTAEGAIEFSWTPTEDTRVRAVAPARTAGGMTYPRLVGTPVEVHVVDPAPTPTTTQVSAANAGGGLVSGNGRYVVYGAQGPGPANADRSTLYRWDRETGTSEEIPRATDGGRPNSISGWPAISADGRFVTFASYASNLVTNDTDNAWDLFLFDAEKGSTTRLGDYARGLNGSPANLAISEDGSVVGFTSTAADLVKKDGNNASDAFLVDVSTGVTRLVETDDDGSSLAGGTNLLGLDADGSSVLVGAQVPLTDDDHHAGWDAYLRDLDSDHLTLVSDLAAGAQLGPSTVSADGRYVAYQEVTGMNVGTSYVWDRRTGDRAEVPRPIDDGSDRQLVVVAGLSADGRFAVLQQNTTKGRSDVFRWDRETGKTITVNGAEFDGVTDTFAYAGGISDDGGAIAFRSVPSAVGGGATVFLWESGD